MMQPCLIYLHLISLVRWPTCRASAASRQPINAVRTCGQEADHAHTHAHHKTPHTHHTHTTHTSHTHQTQINRATIGAGAKLRQERAGTFPVDAVAREPIMRERQVHFQSSDCEWTCRWCNSVCVQTSAKRSAGHRIAARKEETVFSYLGPTFAHKLAEQRSHQVPDERDQEHNPYGQNARCVE